MKVRLAMETATTAPMTSQSGRGTQTRIAKPSTGSPSGDENPLEIASRSPMPQVRLGPSGTGTLVWRDISFGVTCYVIGSGRHEQDRPGLRKLALTRSYPLCLIITAASDNYRRNKTAYLSSQTSSIRHAP